jgi:DNA mismatch repair protein MutS
MTNPPPSTPSLLYPTGANRRAGGRPAPNEADLALTSITRALDYDGRHNRFVASVLADLNAEPAVIGYRQAALDDLLRLPELATSCAALLPQLGELANAGRVSHWSDPIPLVQVAGRLAELDGYVTCVEGLATALDTAGAALHSEAFCALRAYLATTRAQPDYRRLAAELPRLRAQLDQAGSVTLGINLDGQLRAESATVVAVNPGRFAGKGTLLEKLFGDRAAADTVRGITALYRAEEGRQRSPEHDLFRDLDRLLERVAAPIGLALGNYTRVNGAGLAALEAELAFYLGAARLVHELGAAGLPLCRPQIAAVDEQICEVEDAYSLDLALRLRLVSGDAALAQKIVLNAIAFRHDALIFILTGPNSGGKTTYTRAIGQIQVLFQAGLHVPGRHARISPVDGVFSHFAAPERADIGSGRLADGLERLAQIFRQASRDSLVLLNEPLSSTDHGAARALCRDLLAGLQLLGARALVVTHLHELVDDVLGDPFLPGVVSLVAGVSVPAGNGAAPQPSYTIAAGRPHVAGYAAELARRHGLTRDQIAATLRDRGLGGKSAP